MRESRPLSTARPVTMSTTNMTATHIEKRILFMVGGETNDSPPPQIREGGIPRTQVGYLLCVEQRRLLHLAASLACLCSVGYASPVAPASTVKIVAPGYVDLPAPLAALAYPTAAVPRLVKVRERGSGMIACEIFPERTSSEKNPAVLLAELRSRISSLVPTAQWGWGGTYRVAAREWAAWEITVPSLTGSVSAIIAATREGSSMVAVSLSSPEKDFATQASEFGEILSQVKISAGN